MDNDAKMPASIKPTGKARSRTRTELQEERDRKMKEAAKAKTRRILPGMIAEPSVAIREPPTTIASNRDVLTSYSSEGTTIATKPQHQVLVEKTQRPPGKLKNDLDYNHSASAQAKRLGATKANVTASVVPVLEPMSAFSSRALPQDSSESSNDPYSILHVPLGNSTIPSNDSDRTTAETRVAFATETHRDDSSANSSENRIGTSRLSNFYTIRHVPTKDSENTHAESDVTASGDETRGKNSSSIGFRVAKSKATVIKSIVAVTEPSLTSEISSRPASSENTNLYSIQHVPAVSNKTNTTTNATSSDAYHQESVKTLEDKPLKQDVARGRQNVAISSKSGRSLSPPPTHSDLKNDSSKGQRKMTLATQRGRSHSPLPSYKSSARGLHHGPASSHGLQNQRKQLSTAHGLRNHKPPSAYVLHHGAPSSHGLHRHQTVRGLHKQTPESTDYVITQHDLPTRQQGHELTTSNLSSKSAHDRNQPSVNEVHSFHRGHSLDADPTNLQPSHVRSGLSVDQRRADFEAKFGHHRQRQKHASANTESFHDENDDVSSDSIHNNGEPLLAIQQPSARHAQYRKKLGSSLASSSAHDSSYHSAEEFSDDCFENEPSNSGQDGLVLVSMTTPGAYAGGGDASVLVRNHDFRYSLFHGSGHRDEEEAEATNHHNIATDGPSVIYGHQPQGSFTKEGTIAVGRALGNKENERQEQRPLVEASRPSEPAPESTVAQNLPVQGLSVDYGVRTSKLVEARPVRDSSIITVQAQELGVEELHEMEVQEENKRRKACLGACWTMCWCFIIVLVVAFLLIYFLEIKGGDSSSNDEGVNMQPTAAPTPGLFDIPSYTLDSIRAGAATPQARAYRWLRLDPNVETYSLDRLGQRFALATLYFSTSTMGISSHTEGKGQDWHRKRGWLSYDVHECDWWFTKSYQDALMQEAQSSPCGEDEMYQRLWLQNNNLYGTIPPEVSWLRSLRSIDLEGNSLRGAMPSELGLLSDLDHLVLDANFNLTSTFPTEYGLLTKLETMMIQYGQLTGTIPTEFGQLSAMVILAMSGHHLSGTIPSEVAELSQVEYFLLAHNSNLTGTIPAEFSKMSSLRYVLLDGNQLTGHIPSELGLHDNLYFISIRMNNLTGTLPPAIFHAPCEIREFGFELNALTGTLPTEIGNCQYLAGGSLSANNLTGPLPSELGKLSMAGDLYFSKNQLTGSIPTELGLLSNFNSLWLNENQLNGTIPSEFGAFDSITYLFLNGNQLSGSLASELFLMTSLILWDASNNQLTGTLPSEVGQLRSLGGLHLDRNQFQGPIPAEISLLSNLTVFRWN